MVRNGLEFQQINCNKSDMVWCKQQCGERSCLIGNIYRSPNSTQEQDRELFENIRTIVDKHGRDSHVILTGDF